MALSVERATIEPDSKLPAAEARTILESAEFRQLVTRRWRTSLLLTAALFIVYYGYIWLVATNRSLLAMRLGDTTATLGIVFGAAVIVLSWILTAAYVVWANYDYDPHVKHLRDRLR